MENDKQADKIDQFNAFALDYPNHSFVSFISSVRVGDTPEMTKPQLNVLICSAKAPTEILKIQNFSVEDLA